MFHRRHRRTVAITMAVLLASAIGTAASAANPMPEWIDWDRQIAGNEKDLYYAREPDWDTNPCGTRPDFVIFGRVPFGGGEADRVQIEDGCAAVQPDAMVAGDNDLFYVLDAPGDVPQVFRMSLAGGPSEWISCASHRAIGRDDEWIYFINDHVLVRVRQSDITQFEYIATVTVTGEVKRIVTDDDYVYWTESVNATGGAVRAVAKTGGTIFTAAEGPAVEGAWGVGGPLQVSARGQDRACSVSCGLSSG
jgi:hypothetical protein